MSNNSNSKERIDSLLVKTGLVPSRQKAQALIMSGVVLVNDTPVDKPGTKVPSDASIRIKGDGNRFVGRGGEKIDPVFDLFGIDLQNVVAIDIGASTGGFTDSMLSRGAKRVYAVDVGYNQLDLKLRKDPRVVVMERTHAESLTTEQFDPLPSFATIDVSFISVRKILESVLRVLAPESYVLILVKPQFELGREFVSAGGVVRDKAHQEKAIHLVAEHGEKLGLSLVDSVASPLRGQKKGNQEYFAYFRCK